MVETKQTNRNKEFNFGASKEIQDLILKTDNRILLVIINEAFDKLQFKEKDYLIDSDRLKVFDYNTDEFKVFENYVLGNFEEIKGIEEEIAKKKQPVNREETNKLLQQYITKEDEEKLRKALELKNQNNESIYELKEILEQIKENYERFSKIFSSAIKSFYKKKFFQTNDDRYGILIVTEFGMTQVAPNEEDEEDYCYSAEGILKDNLTCLSFKEWKNISFKQVMSEAFIESLFKKNETDAEARMNQLKENIRLQQAKNVGQTTNPRSAR